jgi:hypothetical protein
MCQYEKGDVIKVLPCGHYHHETCTNKWKKHKQTCPQCRYPMDGVKKDETPNLKEFKRLN